MQPRPLHDSRFQSLGDVRLCSIPLFAGCATYGFIWGNSTFRHEDGGGEAAVDTLFPGDARDRIALANTRQDLVLPSAQLGIGVAVVAGSFAKLTDNWKMTSPLRGKITDADINKLEKMVAGSGAYISRAQRRHGTAAPP